MTKRRVSIRGREPEIRSGETPAVNVEPCLPADPNAQAAARAFRRVPTPGGPAGEQPAGALPGEACNGAPLPGGVPARSLPRDEGGLSRPEAEAAMIEEAFAATERPGPAAHAPAPTMEETVKERDRAKGSAVSEPPSSKVIDVSGNALPSRPPRPVLELYQDSPSSRDIQEPETEVKPIELPERGLTEEQRQAILQWWGDSRIQEMSSDIDAAYEEVRTTVGENAAITNEVNNQLLKARDIIIRRDAERLAQAEYYIQQARARLRRASESDAAARKAQWPLMLWGLFWGAAYLTILVLAGMGWFRWLFLPAGKAQSLVELDIFLSAMLWGGIGGAVALLYSLFKHIGMRDFDRHYAISYVSKPFVGLIFGATAYMVAALVVRALGIAPVGLPALDADIVTTIAPGVIYLVAWAAGFKESRLLELVNQSMAQLLGSSDRGQSASPTA